MKQQLIRIGMVLVIIVVMIMNATVIASAAVVPPKDLTETEEAAAYKIIKGNENNVSVVIPVKGFIIPASNPIPSQPDESAPEPKDPGTAPPQTGDNSNAEQYIILLLVSLLTLLRLLTVCKREDDPESMDLDTARS